MSTLTCAHAIHNLSSADVCDTSLVIIQAVVVALAAKEIQVSYNIGGRVDGKNLRVKWVVINSSDVRRSKHPKGSPEVAGDDDDIGVTDESVAICEETAKQRLSPMVQQRAKRVLMRVPDVRTIGAVKELIIWTYSCNMFSELSLSQRRAICLEMDGVLIPESGKVALTGDKQFGDDVTVIFDGRCAMHTIRHRNESEETKFSGLDHKMRDMQRRGSVVASHMQQRRRAAPMNSLEEFAVLSN